MSVDNVNPKEWDFFISHASEDKVEIANDLAEVLRQNYRVWYDSDEIKIGDSIGRAIDNGLAHSTYGVVILSPYFLSKQWPLDELYALMHMQRRVFPILHNITIEEVRAKNPLLLDISAAYSTLGARQLARKIIDAADLPTKTSILIDKISTLRHKPPSFNDQVEGLVLRLRVLGVALNSLKNETVSYEEMAVIVAKMLCDLLIDPALLLTLAKSKDFPLDVYMSDGPFQQFIYDLNPKFHLPLQPPISTEPGGIATTLTSLGEALEHEALPGLYDGHETLSLAEFIYLMAIPVPTQYEIIANNMGYSGKRRIPLPVKYILDIGVAVWHLGSRFVDKYSEQHTDNEGSG